MERKNYLTILSLVLGFFIIFLVTYFVLITKINSNSEKEDSFNLSGLNKESIGVVEIKGAIFESKKTVELLHKAEEKKSIKAIIVRINSPGGAVGPSQEIYEEIKRIDKIKPVYASFETVAASGGYYIAAATRKIFSNAGALTGSIGVISQFYDISEVYKYFKVKPQVLKSGKFKDVGSSHRQMTPEERAYMTALLYDVHDQFRKDILEIRKKKIKKDIKEISEGQVFTGLKAKELGLVDEISGLWGAARSIHKELKLKSKLKVVFIKEKEKSKFSELFDDLESKIEGLFIKTLDKLPLFM